MADVDVSVVLPAYLEEENLRLLLPRITQALSSLDATFEVLVIDTVTPLDGTAGVASALGARVISRGPGNSFGDAVRTGLSEAQGAAIIFMDADGSHSPELLPLLVAEGKENDVVIASRYVAGGYSETDLALKIMSRVLNLSYSLILGLDVKDVSNSYKLYRSTVLEGIRLRCENFDIIEELLFKIRRRHPDARMKEIPTTFKKRMFGETKRNLLLFILTYIFTIFRLRFFSE